MLSSAGASLQSWVSRLCHALRCTCRHGSGDTRGDSQIEPRCIHRAFVLALLQQTIRHRGIENLRVTLSAYAPIVARLPWESFIDAEGLVEGRVQLRYQGVLILDEESGTYEYFWEALHDFASSFVTYLPNEFVLLGE